MKEEPLNLLLSQPVSPKEITRLRTQIDTKNERLQEIASALDQPSPPPELSIAYLLLKREIDRLKHLLHLVELQKTKTLENQWIFGQVPETHSPHLQRFATITREYFELWPTLSFHNRDPPAEYYIHARAIEDCGIVQMGSTFVEAKKGSLYYARKKDIAHLLHTGLMQPVPQSKI
ncbi:hypothetical protein NEHOM01_1744 [Nematocida homosporus]|uniref:uncharacterized protein n=1 Tax=Nematocida homosporus TaxID=1912981 RepID=UPI0022210EFA|nr:uncharacterized protein NEHOM01_1744 [Nematocida homosporus]KAI5186849.1 hypothetical protein NEHOM01_1744 [Nematocida homosporus]